MYAFINSPQVSEGGAIIGSLEYKVILEGRLIDEPVDEEFGFVKDTDVVLLVLNLEVAT